MLDPAKGEIVVQFYVNDKIKLDKGSEVHLVSTDLFNTRALEIKLGNAAPAYFAKNDTLPGYIAGGLLDKVGEQFSPLVERINGLVDSLNAAIEPSKMRGTVSNLEQTTAALNEMLSDKNSQLNKILKDVASISNNIKNNNEVINAALANVNAITDSLAKSRLTETIAQAHLALAQTTAVMQKVNNGEGSLGQLVNDQKLYEHLNKSAADLDSLLIDLKANPKRYLHFSVFGRK
jgi:phospholipid/cholesterol/gamma-HCH transport system substrate-binding protein